MDVIIKIEHTKKSKEVKDKENKFEYDQYEDPAVFLNDLLDSIKEKIMQNQAK